MTIIEVDGLRKVYDGRAVVDGVSFAVAEGEVFGILGPNGAGKTTTVECVAGLRVPDGGRVRVAGLDPVARHREVTEVLGVQLQSSELQAKLTVREALELHSAFYRRPADWRTLAERLGLADRLKVRFAALSGGQRQRLFIALALLGDPRVVVLDELTTGLDPHARRATWELVEEIRDAGVTVVLVTHVMEEAQRLCDRVAVIDGGRVSAVDSPTGLIRGRPGTVTITFVPSRVPDAAESAELAALPGAVGVDGTGREDDRGGRIEVRGGEETSPALFSLLARRGITAGQLRVTESTLDDAYLALTDDTFPPGGKTEERR
ncbi:ABC transporter ATP-binding protein [Streptomyces profundus]|uniref:ABC transporter ATP-binding protein n=1 Tax=Streptomyces profundus TaxID=2867410 RepID=UPI001D16D6E3|nr:ABC transporter ATP-binding protein [Streptomyces sp. MA3_2.13]UED87877.1 ABC transporter ATP-binding protein [Streptomyces sp. MA3_2.13]